MGSPSRRIVGFAVAFASALVLAPAAWAATYSVTSTQDAPAANAAAGCQSTLASGACTLRSAIQAANAAGGMNTIDLPAGTYTLTAAGGKSDGTAGALVVSSGDTLTIDGAGSSATAIDANYLDRALTVDAGASLTLSATTIEHGRAGGLGNTASCPASGSYPSGADGGAILADGDVALDGDVLTDNWAPGAGGAVAAEGGGNLTVTDTEVTDNVTCQSSGYLTPDGGGIYASYPGSVAAITDSSITGNQAGPAGGSAPSGYLGQGGGLALENGVTATVSQSTIAGNSASEGGGIFALAVESSTSVTLTQDAITGNLAQAAPRSIVAAEVRPHASSPEAFAPGGGLLDAGAAMTLANSTVADNTASDGGGIAAAVGKVTVSFATITDNTAVNATNPDGSPTAANLENTDPSNPGNATFTLDDSILARGGAPAGADLNCNAVGFNSEGYNLFDENADQQCGTSASDIVDPDVGVGSLQDNGGPTETEALSVSSPAVNAANNSVCEKETGGVDQRGVTRPQGPGCDIGAFELQEADLAVSSSAEPSTVQQGNQTTLTDTVTNHGFSDATDVTLTDPAPAGFQIDSVSPSQGSCTNTATTVSCDLGSLAVGAVATVKVVLTPTTPGSLTLSASVSSPIVDPNLANNHTSTTITVLAAPTPTPTTPKADLALAKHARPTRLQQGKTTTFTLKITNHGPDADHGVVLVDPLPRGLRWLSTRTSQGRCSGHRRVVCRLGSLAASASATVHIRVRALHTGRVTNIARVTGAVLDPDLANNRAHATVIITLPPCRANLVFATHYRPQEHVGTIKIYIDGRLRRVRHGHDIRRVTVAEHGRATHSVTVLFIISPYQTVSETRSYKRCRAGRPYYAFPPQTNPGAS